MFKKSNHQFWTFFALPRIFAIYIVRKEMSVYARSSSYFTVQVLHRAAKCRS